MKQLPFILGITVALLITACDKREDTALLPPSEFPVIGMIDNGDHQIVLHTSDAGPLYTIRTPDGKTLAQEINAEAFAAQFPEAYLNVKTLWAGNEHSEHKASFESSPIIRTPR